MAFTKSNGSKDTSANLDCEAMVALDRDNAHLKGALNKNYGRADLDKHRLVEFIDFPVS